MLQWCSYLPVAFAEKAMATESLDVEYSALEDGWTSFGDGDSWTTTSVIVTDAAIGVLSEEHFAIEISVRNSRVGGSAGGGVADKEWVDGSCRFVAVSFAKSYGY